MLDNNSNILNNIRVVLCDTSHNGNIGSAARAMKTMGITDLYLVSPKTMPDDHSLALSCNAREVVTNAKIVDSLDDALLNTTLAFATTSRRREFNQHLFTPKEIIPEVFNAINKAEKIALVFGAEKTGLTIPQLEKCNRLLTIPGNPDYFSLNLANAVQIICYEIYANFNSDLSRLKADSTQMAKFEDNQGIISHLDTILSKIDFYKNQDRTIRNLQNIINKANLTRDEVDLLRGILGKIEKNLKSCN